MVGGDRSLDKFRNEYEKLHKALIKSHENEKRLTTKCRELNSELVTNSAKVQSAVKLSEDDKNTIATLRKEIDKAWKMVDAAHEKEQRAKETIQSLRLEITNLSKLVEQGAGKIMSKHVHRTMKRHRKSIHFICFRHQRGSRTRRS